MDSHKKSDGTVCPGCDCDQSKLTHIIAGIAHTGCCGMRFAHGTYEFDANGNVVKEPTCCAGKDCKDETPQDCDAHAPNEKKGHVVEVKAKFDGGKFPEKKAEALANKLRALSARDNKGTPTGNRVSDAVLVTVDAGKGEAVARVYALKKVKNPNNPDPEWHHVAPTKAEVDAVKNALG